MSVHSLSKLGHHSQQLLAHDTRASQADEGAHDFDVHRDSDLGSQNAG
jgi:quinol monooxygenase YgiN